MSKIRNCKEEQGAIYQELNFILRQVIFNC